jgi:hypothetical protein
MSRKFGGPGNARTVTFDMGDPDAIAQIARYNLTKRQVMGLADLLRDVGATYDEGRREYDDDDDDGMPPTPARLTVAGELPELPF